MTWSTTQNCLCRNLLFISQGHFLWKHNAQTNPGNHCRGELWESEPFCHILIKYWKFSWKEGCNCGSVKRQFWCHTCILLDYEAIKNFYFNARFILMPEFSPVEGGSLLKTYGATERRDDEAWAALLIISTSNGRIVTFVWNPHDGLLKAQGTCYFLHFQVTASGTDINTPGHTHLCT